MTSYCKSCISFDQRLSPCIGPFCEATCTLTWWLWQLQQDCLETQHLRACFYPVKVKFKTAFTYTSAVGVAAATLVAGLLASSSLVSPSKVCWPIATSVLNGKQPFWFSMLTVRKKCSSSELALASKRKCVCEWWHSKRSDTCDLWHHHAACQRSCHILWWQLDSFYLLHAHSV